MYDYNYGFMVEGDRKKLGYEEKQGAQPVSMDFEIMRIFPFCGFLLSFAVLVFALELAAGFGRSCWNRIRRAGMFE